MTTFRREEAAAIAATADLMQATEAIAWVDARLRGQLEQADEFRRAELEGMLAILAMHQPEEVTDEWDQAVWRCRAKCSGESWRCYTDGEQVVASPCPTIHALARPYAGLPDFPAVLRVAA